MPAPSPGRLQILRATHRGQVKKRKGCLSEFPREKTKKQEIETRLSFVPSRDAQNKRERNIHNKEKERRALTERARDIGARVFRDETKFLIAREK